MEAFSALQGGGQTYLKNLFLRYPGYSDTRVVALVPDDFEKELPVNDLIEVRTSAFASRGIVYRILWNKFVLPRLLRNLKANVLYSPGGFLPTRAVGDCRTAVAFRNMLPFSPDERRRYPLGYTRGRLWLLQHIQGASFRDADLVIFISRFAKSVIDLTVGKRKGQSVVISHGLSGHFIKPQPRPADPRLPQEYVLYVSILNVYKAQMEVVRAWAELRARRSTSEKLLLIGPEYFSYGEEVRETIIDLGLQNEVLVWGNVPYAELPGYYQYAKVNIFASSCENCPNILLEALAGGRPVVCSDYQPMPEFGADAVTYFDPYNSKQLADVLDAMLDDPTLMADMGKRALQRSRDFDWGISAHRTWDALFALVNKED